MQFGGALWGGTLWAGGLWGGLRSPALVPAAAGAGGGLDAWDRAFSRELEKLWLRPKHANRTLTRRKRREEEEQEAEAAEVLRMLGFLD